MHLSYLWVLHEKGLQSEERKLYWTVWNHNGGKQIAWHVWLWKYFPYIFELLLKSITWGYTSLKGKTINPKKRKIADSKNSSNSVEHWKGTKFYEVEQGVRAFIKMPIRRKWIYIYQIVRWIITTMGIKIYVSFLTRNN